MTVLLDAAHSQLVVIDAQARLVPALRGAEAMLARVLLLAEAAAQLGVPATASEQHPQGLGATMEPVRAALGGNAAVLPKMSFSAMSEAAFRERLETLSIHGRGSLVICGCEAHVCVLQTALAARESGFAVSLVADAVASRRSGDHEMALRRATAAGIDIVTAEMVVFEWLKRAGSDAFKRLLPSIKSLS